MPRKDGTPTAAERRDAERTASNERFIAERPDHDLAAVRRWMDANDEWAVKIDAELARRHPRAWTAEHPDTCPDCAVCAECFRPARCRELDDNQQCKECAR